CVPCFFFYSYSPPRYIHSFPTRRSSDLGSGSERSQPRDDAGERLGEGGHVVVGRRPAHGEPERALGLDPHGGQHGRRLERLRRRSEEHTSELQSPDHLVCRLLLEKKKSS